MILRRPLRTKQQRNRTLPFAKKAELSTCAWPVLLLFTILYFTRFSEYLIVLSLYIRSGLVDGSALHPGLK
jgi:hypothetical protein